MQSKFFQFSGTGKTHVLVAAIEEIVRDKRKENYVLVCSNSNAACDELFGRLLEIFDYHEVYRLYTVSHDSKNVDTEYLKLSNWDEHAKAFTMPELWHLYSVRVVVCTLAVASNLTRANISPAFKPDHFSHIIIDESCCNHETMTMIPIAGKTLVLR